jgi:hypothetical protein
MTIAHQWTEQTEEGRERCIHCGTSRAMHNAAPQNCVPRWSEKEALGPEPGRRVYAVDDTDTIYQRIRELDMERQERLNKPPEPDPEMD